MKNGAYESRREQIEAFAVQVEKKETPLADALRDAAMVGACEDRARTLELIRRNVDASTCRKLVKEICNTSVLEVLGYE